MKRRRNFVANIQGFDILDKIRAYYIDDISLSELQEKKRLQYEQAFQLQSAGYSKEQTIKILKKKGVIDSERTGYYVCNCAERLFGNVAESNKKGLRVILTENFFRHYRRVITANDFREANRALENIAKINGLMNSHDSIDYSDLRIPIPVYTTNPEVLKLQANSPDHNIGDIISSN